MNSNLFFALLYLAFGILNLFLNINIYGLIFNFLNGMMFLQFLIEFGNDLKNKK